MPSPVPVSDRDAGAQGLAAAHLVDGLVDLVESYAAGGLVGGTGRRAADGDLEDAVEALAHGDAGFRFAQFLRRDGVGRPEAQGRVAAGLHGVDGDDLGGAGGTGALDDADADAAAAD